MLLHNTGGRFKLNIIYDGTLSKKDVDNEIKIAHKKGKNGWEFKFGISD